MTPNQAFDTGLLEVEMLFKAPCAAKYITVLLV
jgi:hypothetical protein